VKEGKPSATAEANAAFRAAEWIYPEKERLIYDAFAYRFLGLKFKLIARSRLLTRIALWYADRIIPNAQNSVVVRHRYMDDYLEACIDAGVEQLVILGAGYDSRAYRFDRLSGKVRVFEVDHPDTLAAKVKKVKKVFGALPDHVVYVSIDFNSEKLGERLFESGYNKNMRTLFIWEGVTVYLTNSGVDETLSFVSNNSGDGSSIIFDYAYRSSLDGTLYPEDARKWRAAFEQRAEAPRFGLEEKEIENYLVARGFSHVKSVSMESLENVYFRSKGIGRKVTRLGGIVHADVAPGKRPIQADAS